MKTPAETLIYHITDLANLADIIAGSGLRPDVAMDDGHPSPIGYSHIKERRAREIRVECCGYRFCQLRNVLRLGS